MESLPEATRFRWVFNSSLTGQSLPVSPDQFSSNGTYSILDYVAEHTEDFGQLKCFASNELGETMEPCLFNLLAAGKKIEKFYNSI